MMLVASFPWAQCLTYVLYWVIVQKFSRVNCHSAYSPDLCPQEVCFGKHEGKGIPTSQPGKSLPMNDELLGHYFLPLFLKILIASDSSRNKWAIACTVDMSETYLSITQIHARPLCIHCYFTSNAWWEEQRYEETKTFDKIWPKKAIFAMFCSPQHLLPQ